MKAIDELIEKGFTKFEELELEQQSKIKKHIIKKIKAIKNAIEGVDIDEELKKRKNFSRNASILLWQFIRFNTSYYSDYDKFKKSKLNNEYAKKRWLINEFVNPKEFIPPKNFRCLKYQSYEIVNDNTDDFLAEADRLIKKKEILFDAKDRAGISSEILFLRIDSRADFKSIFNDIKKLNSKFKKKKKYAYNLLDLQVVNFLIYHSKRRYGFTEKDTLTIFDEVYERKSKTIRVNKEDSAINKFLEIANKAPFIFY